jgi:hypothetical protein
MISIALLLFELAEGDLTGVSVVAPVTFEKEGVVLVFGWVAFFYLWGRYRVRSKGMWAKVKHDWIVSVQVDKGYKKIVAELDNESIPRTYRGNATPLIVRGWRSRKLDYSKNLSGVHEIKYQNATTPAPYLRVLAVECRGVLSAIFHHPAITDYVLPQVIAAVTLIVGIGLNVNSIFRWLGGILGLS